MNKQVIICVDDEPTLLETLKDELKAAIGQDYRIELAEGANDALELIAQLLKNGYEIPLIIADHIMPDMKGDELLRQVHLLSPKTLKVMLTGQGDLAAVGNAIRYGKLYRYIAKPWQAEDLQLTVQEAVNSYRQEKKIAEQTAKLQEMNQVLEELNREQAMLIAKLQENESRLTQFLEAMPIGVAVHDRTGQVTYVNQAAQEIARINTMPEAKPEQLSEVYRAYIAGTNQLYPTTQLPIARSLKGETVKVDDMEVRQLNNRVCLEVSSTPIFDETGKITYAIAAFQDITERKQAEKLLTDYKQTLEHQVAERTLELAQEKEALQQQKELLQAIVARIPVMIVLYAANGEIQFVNQEVERLLGWSQAELQDIDLLSECFPVPDDCQYAREHMMAATGKWQDFKIQLRDGNTLDTCWANVRLSNGVHIGIGQDISDRKLAEEASILEERNRMAREIHDILAQAFTGILIHLGAVSKKIITDPNAAQTHLKTVRDLARSGLAEARRSVAALRPQLLEEGDLCSALNRFVKQMKSSADIHLNCEVIGTAYPLPADVENNLLRIGQEALINAIKYAHASEIRVELVYESTQCILRVKDNGQGFEIDSVPLNTSFGLLGMSERVERIGGNLMIQSQLGQGTEVVAIVNREGSPVPLGENP
jgi:PAS domain S-box-containing protein